MDIETHNFLYFKVCRLAFELSQAFMTTEVSQMHTYTSLDDMFYFNGQHEQQLEVVMNHKLTIFQCLVPVKLSFLNDVTLDPRLT